MQSDEITNLKVWIDQDLCTGDGLCTEICPDIFEMHDDGLAYVKEVGWKSIAGPDGGTKNKPVGLVFIGIIYKNKVIILEKKFQGTRIQIQKKTVKSIFPILQKLI